MKMFSHDEVPKFYNKVKQIKKYELQVAPEIIIQHLEEEEEEEEQEEEIRKKKKIPCVDRIVHRPRNHTCILNLILEEVGKGHLGQ